MSIVLKQETVSIKDKDGKYRTLNTLSEKTTDEIVSEIIERIPPISDISSVRRQGCIIAISISNGSETLFSIGSEYENLEQNEEKNDSNHFVNNSNSHIKPNKYSDAVEYP